MKYFWLKVTGIALLLHIVLIIISILEVAVYSYLVEPGKDAKFYSNHAEVSGPWISAVFGSIFTFELVRRYIKRYFEKRLTYSISLPLIYIVIDLIIFVLSGVNIGNHLIQFIPAAGVKALSALAAYYIYNSKYQKP